MINRINRAYESIKINSSTKSHEIKGKEVQKSNNHVYNPKTDYSFLDLDRLITSMIERHLAGGNINSGLDLIAPQFLKNGGKEWNLKFSKEFFDIIEPIVNMAYEKKSLGELEYYKYREHIAAKVLTIANVANDTIKEYLDISSKPNYDEKSLRKAADDYFMDELNKKDMKNIDNEGISNQYNRVRDIAKFRVMNDKECINTLAELKALI